MSYIKKTITCCGEIEIIKFYGGMLGNHSKRGNAKKAAESVLKKVEKHNFKMAAKKLYNLLRANFDTGDWHLALTYRPDIDVTPDTAEKEMHNFLKRLRYRCKRDGITLKYIWNTDVSAKGKIHHHIILPKAISLQTLDGLWRLGRVHDNSRLYPDKDFYGLACYLIDPSHKGELPDTHVKNKKRYKCSNNLIRPVVDYEIIHAARWSAAPRAPKGYRIKPDSLYNSIDDFTGYPYQSYVLIPDFVRRI